MYHDEIHHRGRPHFHARYAEDEASIELETLTILAGELPPRALRLVSSIGRVPIARSCSIIGSARVSTSRWSRSSRSDRVVYHHSMRSTPLLIEAEPVKGYIVHVRFEDGTAADVDLGYLVEYGGVFEPLRDPGYFRRLRADSEAGTIVWPNDADIAPETLYSKAKQQAASLA